MGTLGELGRKSQGWKKDQNKEDQEYSFHSLIFGVNRLRIKDWL